MVLNFWVSYINNMFASSVTSKLSECSATWKSYFDTYLLCFISNLISLDITTALRSLYQSKLSYRVGKKSLCTCRL